MSFLNKLFGKRDTGRGENLSDLPTYWRWISSDDPLDRFAAVGCVESVFRKHPEAVGGEEYKKSVALLRGLVHENSKGLQALVIRTLGLIGATEALPEILEMANDSDPKVREAAALALKYLPNH